MNKRTEKEARELSKKGGKKSGASRRSKKTLREVLKSFVNMPVSSSKDKKKLENVGLAPTYGGLLICEITKTAGKSAGMARLLMEMLDEIGQSNVVINNSVDSGMSGLINSLNRAREQQET